MCDKHCIHVYSVFSEINRNKSTVSALDPPPQQFGTRKYTVRSPSQCKAKTTPQIKTLENRLMIQRRYS